MGEHYSIRVMVDPDIKWRFLSLLRLERMTVSGWLRKEIAAYLAEREHLLEAAINKPRKEG